MYCDGRRQVVAGRRAAAGGRRQAGGGRVGGSVAAPPAVIPRWVRQRLFEKRGPRVGTSRGCACGTVASSGS